MKVKMLIALPLSLLLSLSNLSFADDKEKKEKEKIEDKTKLYKGYSYDQVWKASVQAAAENFSVDHSDKEAGVFEFHTGMSLTSNGFRCSVTVSKTDEGEIRVKVNTQKKGQLFAWGAGGRITDKFFKSVDKKLKEMSEDTKK